MSALDPATIGVLVTALTGIGGALAGILRELVKSRAPVAEMTEKLDTLNAVLLRHIARDHGGDVWPAEPPPDVWPPRVAPPVRRRSARG